MSSTCPSTGLFGTCLTRITSGQAVGLSVDLETGLLSSLAVIIFLLLVVRNVLRHSRNSPPGGWSLLRTHIDVYFLCLLVFELLHGLAAVMSAKWIHQGEVYCSLYCTIQGAMRNVGSTGVALVTLAIAVHTFSVIFFQWIPPRSLLIPTAVLLGIWTFLIVYLSYELSIPRAVEKSFFTPTPYWCWIGPSHTAARIWGQYLWIWLSAFLSILLYVPLYFCVKGNLLYRPHSPWKIRISRTPKIQEDGEPSRTNAAKVATTDAMCMLYYPAVYVSLCLPLSIVRFMSTSWQEQGKSFPFAATVTGSALFGLSGLFNVVLFITTRPNLLLFYSRPASPLLYKVSGIRSPRANLNTRHAGYPTSPPSTGQSAELLVAGSRAAHNPWRDFEMT